MSKYYKLVKHVVNTTCMTNKEKLELAKSRIIKIQEKIDKCIKKDGTYDLLFNMKTLNEDIRDFLENK